MKKALRQAEKAAGINEVPVGAVIVCGGKILVRSHNLKEKKGNALLHAEMVAIAKASKKIGDWRLNDCEIYVTLEPCPMCAGALINARIGKIYFGAYDQKWGCCGTLYNLTADERFNHRPPVVGGVLEEDCRGVLQDYFRKKRAENRVNK